MAPNLTPSGTEQDIASNCLALIPGDGKSRHLSFADPSLGLVFAVSKAVEPLRAVKS